MLQRCFYEIAENPKVQQELIDEIDKIVDALNGGPVTCEALCSMNLLEMVIQEVLRKWPPIPFGSRVCTKDCIITTDDGESLKFIKGDLIHLPFQMIQNDPDYFYNPEKFDPSRFINAETKKNFLAFGLGPRNCIGSHFVLLQTKIFMFTILNKFSVKVSEKLDSKENVFLQLNQRK